MRRSGPDTPHGVWPATASRRAGATQCAAAVCTLSKFATQSPGAPSSTVLNSSFDVECRLVRVGAATTIDWMRSASGSRVSRRTRRSAQRSGDPDRAALNPTSLRAVPSPRLPRGPSPLQLAAPSGISRRRARCSTAPCTAAAPPVAAWGCRIPTERPAVAARLPGHCRLGSSASPRSQNTLYAGSDLSGRPIVRPR
jgi:hypothetical protein